MFRVFFGILLSLGTFVSVATAGAVMTTTGRGAVSVVPDLAIISVGVEVQAPTADRAMRLNSARMKDVFAALRLAGVAKSDMQTDQLSLYPQRENLVRNQTSAQKITGFSASNQIEVTVRDLPRLGAVLDALTKAGANRIQGIRFALANPVPALDRARVQAVGDAQRKAALYAKAAGLTLGAILSIDEAGSNQGQISLRQSVMSAAVPIAEGELSFSASVTIRFNLAD